jgi:cell division protein FtsQ
VRTEQKTILAPLGKAVSPGTAAVIFSALILFIGLLLAIDHALRPSTFPVRSVSFEGEFKHVDQQQLARALNSLVQGNFFLLDLDTIKARTESVPWVHRASVRRKWPDGVYIRFTEQDLAASWGTGAWVNASGEAVDLQGRPGLDGLPHFDGPEGSQKTVLEHHRSLSEILSPAGLRITAMQLTARRTWEITLDNNIVLVVGREEPEKKVARFARLYPQALALRSDRIKQVDLRYTNGFAVEWSEASPQAGNPRLGRS